MPAIDDELAQALLAGWLSGAVAGLVATAVVLVFASRRPALATRLPWQQRLPILGIIFANGFTLLLTLIGLVLGALFHRTGGEEGALRFALVVGGSALVVAALYVFVRGRLRAAEAPAVFSLLGVVVLCFGLLLPWLGSLEA